MKYYSHYIWESGSVEKQNPVSVILQQIKLRHHQCLLGCICDGGKSRGEAALVSGYLTERLVEWFHHRCIPILQKNLREESMQVLLESELSRIHAELQEYGSRKNILLDYDVLGMVIYDNLFWCFAKGECKGYLFNRRFNKKQRCDLHKRLFPAGGREKIQLMQGTLQKGIRILLCSDDFDTNISEEEMLEVLFEEKLQDKDMQKRLKELWIENVKRGGREYAGAVFFKTE